MKNIFHLLVASLVLGACSFKSMPMQYTSTSCSGSGSFAAWAEKLCPDLVEGMAMVKEEKRELLYGTPPIQGWERTRTEGREFNDKRPERVKKYDPARDRDRFGITKESWYEHGTW